MIDPNVFRGRGLATSSMLQVLETATQDLQNGAIDREAVANRALAKERVHAGFKIAANDVFPIVFGGTREIRTFSDGLIEHEVIPHNISWERHLILAIKKDSVPREAPAMLRKLFDHRRAAESVSEITRIAKHLVADIRVGDLHQIGLGMRKYVSIFDDWMDHTYVTRGVADLAADLDAQWGDNFIAWKPPGAGGADSVVILTGEPVEDSDLDFLRCRGWIAKRMVETRGLDWSRSDSCIKVTVPARIDLIGAADLGQEIGVDGTCIAITVEPRWTRHGKCHVSQASAGQSSQGD